MAKKRLVSVLVAALKQNRQEKFIRRDNTGAAAGERMAGKAAKFLMKAFHLSFTAGRDERNEATLKVIEQFEAALPKHHH